MKKRVFIIITFLASITIHVSAQQAPLFGLTSQLLPVSNPSLSKGKQDLNITLAGRKYWSGIPNGPEAYIATFGISPQAHKSALGGYIWRENAPMISKQVFGLNYAYGINNLDERVNLRMGLGMDFISINSTNSSVLVDDYNDPYYTGLFSNNRSSFDLRAGAALTLSDLEIGLAMHQVVSSVNKIGETTNGSLNFNNASSVSGHLKYAIKSGEGSLITPLVYWQTQKGAPLRFDINILAEKTGKVWGGVWLRPRAAGGIMAGLWILPEVKVGYMYEKTFFKSLTNAGRSHEIMVSYTPNFASKKTPEPEKEPLPEVKMPEVIRVVDTLVIVKEIRITEAATPKAEEAAPKAKETPAPKNEEVVEETPEPRKGTFYVITGLFSVKENADKLCKKLQTDGYRTQLVMKKPQNQFYVSVGKFTTEEDAQAFIKDNPNPNYTFWVKEIND